MLYILSMQDGNVVQATDQVAGSSSAAAKARGSKRVWLDWSRVAGGVGVVALQTLVNATQAWAVDTSAAPGAVPGTSHALLHAGSKWCVAAGTSVAPGPFGISPTEVVKGILQLVQRGSQFRSAAHSFVTLVTLSCLLAVSESALLSQWSVAMAAYASCFGAVPVLREYGGLLNELLHAIWCVLPLLCTHHYRGAVFMSAGSAVAVMLCCRDSVVLIPRITAAVAVGVSCLVWRLQRQHQLRKEHLE
jgi:hypothetical protein